MNIRTTKPGAGNKFYITAAKGGFSTCIQGSPTDSQCNVLANCVGYACGRFNEIIGTMKYPSLNCNAENFIERAQSLGLTISQTPSEGAIMCWRKGQAGNSADGAGHVAIVEKVNSPTSVYTSESGYGGSAFWNQTRNKGDGNWGTSGSYVFRGFIVNPGVNVIPTGSAGTPVARDSSRAQIQVNIEDLRARKRPETSDAVIVGFIKPGIYNILETRDMAAEASNGYYWYRVEDALWVAKGSWLKELEVDTEQDKDALIVELRKQVDALTAQVKSLTSALEKAANDLATEKAAKDKLQQAYSARGEVLSAIEQLAKNG